MPIEFLGMAGTNDRSETRARSGPVIDKEYTLRLARAHEDNGWDRVLFGYSSASPDCVCRANTYRQGSHLGFHVIIRRLFDTRGSGQRRYCGA
jgi:hypothetical protein